MDGFIASLCLLLGGSLAGAFGKKNGFTVRISALCCFLGSSAGLVSTASILLTQPSVPPSISWPMPLGRFSLAIDPLSAFFLVPGFILGSMCSIYGAYSLKSAKNGHQGVHWCFFNLMVAFTALVTTATESLFFLISWEIMSVSPYLLILFNDTDDKVRRAGWVYLVAAHVGGLFVLVTFALLGAETGAMSFSGFASLRNSGAGVAGVIFITGLIGFGAKAGLFPAHVWLPEAHPAAPSHVSAFLSAALIKCGVYGFLRLLSFLPPPGMWQGVLLVCLALATAVFGAVNALAKRDLKRMLAYSSIENTGIIFLGTGLGVFGLAVGSNALAGLGFAGSLLHVFNHCLLKGGLFLCAGNVLHATGTTASDQLGGLMKKMPYTGVFFMLFSLSISGIPPLNGFAGELLIYFCAAGIALPLKVIHAAVPWLVIGGLALVSTVAAAAFMKTAGIAFLGAPRSERAAHAHEATPGECLPIAMFALASAASALAAPFLYRLLHPAVSIVAGISLAHTDSAYLSGYNAMRYYSFTAILIVIPVAALTVIRGLLLRGRTVGGSVTWDCGYLRPAARMQYSSASFAWPFLNTVRGMVGLEEKYTRPEAVLPGRSSVESSSLDVSDSLFFKPLFQRLGSLFDTIKELQHGETHLYILYIFIALIAVLIWRLA